MDHLDEIPSRSVHLIAARRIGIRRQSAPAQAELLVDPFGRPAYRLNEKDLGLLKEAVRQVLEKQQVARPPNGPVPLRAKPGRRSRSISSSATACRVTRSSMSVPRAMGGATSYLSAR
jgi:hypothetical protein